MVHLILIINNQEDALGQANEPKHRYIYVELLRYREGSRSLEQILDHLEILYTDLHPQIVKKYAKT